MTPGATTGTVCQMSIGGGLPAGEKKYELVLDRQIIVGRTTLYRIRALKDFGNVKAGDLGGFVRSEENLSQLGDCWVFDDAKIYDQVVVSDGAQIHGLSCVFGHSWVGDRGRVLGNAQVFGYGRVFKDGLVFDNAKVMDHGQVRDHGMVFDNGIICDRARVLAHGQVCGDARIDGRTVVESHEKVSRFGSQEPPQGPSSGGRGRRPRSPRGPRP